ncbi:MAG TPA: GGDEF domain-containing protein [Actinomycetales bacterium]|nr:GGDEF domain-containing protein [Actinomycetales bacterium]
MSRRPRAVDAAAVVLMAVGAALVIATGDPGWTSLAAVGAAALGLGGLRGRWMAALLALLGMAWAAGLVSAVLDPSLWAVRDSVAWGGQAMALGLGAALALVAVRRATANRREVQRALEFAQDATVHDPLTDLANRKGLDLLGDQILESARRRGDAVYCIFVDVDGLGRVSGRLGQSGVDEVLLTVADALRRTTRKTDAVARWGDGEFVVIGPGTGLAPQEMERRIRAQCSEHSTIDRTIWHARVSAGGAVLEPWDDGSIESLLRQANREMHLRRALRREAGVPAYQPTRLDPSPQPPQPRQLNE